MTANHSQCPEFRRYMEEFRERLRFAIDENKWFLSEKARHDVGLQIATEDFLNNHFDRFAEEVRAEFCRHKCSLQENCPLASFVRSLPASAKALEIHRKKTKAAEPALN